MFQSLFVGEKMLWDNIRSDELHGFIEQRKSKYEWAWESGFQTYYRIEKWTYVY